MSPFNLNRILLLFVVFIVYGSLYPFDFTTAPRKAYELDALYYIDIDPPRWGDLISNVLLFIPFGFLGMAMGSSANHPARQFAILALSGAGLAFGLQVIQIFLPTRIPSLIDALCNILGIFLGGLLFLPLRAITWPSLPTLTRTEYMGFGLIAAWALDNLWPLVPGFDMQTLNEGLKPLIMHPPISIFKVFLTATGWMLMIHLWEFVQKKPPKILCQILAVTTMFGLEILMEANALEWEEVLGALLALLVWNLGISHFIRRTELLVGVLIAMLVWKGLSPLDWREVPVVFHWMPFGISIMGDPLYQISVMIQKFFHYGCLAWLLAERKTPLIQAFMLSAGTLMCLEGAQRYLVGHTPEITDPFMAFLLVLLINNEFQRQRAADNHARENLAHSNLPLHSMPS